ncbi:hypothetical protein BH10PSE13_BH10PSE13_23960 [soil metagenome]
MLPKILLSGLLLIAPSALLATPQTETHELLRAPPGKTVMVWRPIKRQQTASISCHPDSTKAFWCGARKAEISAQAAATRPERLSER